MPSWTGTVVCAASGIRRTKPASTKPMSAMNRPMPTEIATFSCGGHGVEDRLPEAGEHQHQDDQALEHDQAHRVGPGHLGRDRERDERVQAEPGGQRQRVVGDDAHQDRHHAGDQRRRRRRSPAGWAVAGAAAEEVPVTSGREAEDQRVQHDDVGHREEGDDAAADLPLDGGATLGDLEEPVQPALVSARGISPRCGTALGPVG